MLLSTETGWLRRRFDDKTAVRMIKEADFDAFDYSFCYSLDQPEKDMLGEDYLERAYELKEFMEEIGIVCNQSHAPLDFRHWDEISLSDYKYLRNIRSIEVASILGCKNIIVHALGSVLNSDLDYFEYNRNYLRSYIPYCKKFNVHISVENLSTVDSERNAIGVPGITTPEEIISWVESLGSEWFNFCVDTGHAAISGVEPENLISALNNKQLAALHIHDNNRLDDQHLLPYEGKLNWDNITAALRKIDYKGDFTLESTNFFNPVPNELVMPALKFAEKTGRYLIDKIKVAH